MISIEASPAAEGVRSGGPQATCAVVADHDAQRALLELLLKRSGMSLSELARRLGRAIQTVNQYRTKRRGAGMRLDSFLRWVSACGGKVIVEFPE